MSADGGGGGGDKGAGGTGGGFSTDLGSLFGGDSGSSNLDTGYSPPAADWVTAGTDTGAVSGAGPSPADWTAGTSFGTPFGTPDLTPTSSSPGPSFSDLLSVPSSSTVGDLGSGFGLPPGMTTSDASMSTGVQPGSGGAVPSPTGALSGSGGGPSFAQWTAGATPQTPVAAGGATAISAPDTSPTTSLANPVTTQATAPGAAASTPAAGVAASSLAPAAATATGTAPADATSSWVDKLKEGLSKGLVNPSTWLTAAGLGYNILQGQKTSANQQALTDIAKQAAANQNTLTQAGIKSATDNTATASKVLDQGLSQTAQNIATNTKLTDQGTALQSYLTSGTLPPQYMSQIDQAIADAKTTAVSNAAKNGQPTDPTKNTALAQSLAQIDNQKPAMITQIANQLFGAGQQLVGTGTAGNQAAAGSLTSGGLNLTGNTASSLLQGGQGQAGLSGQLYTTLTGIDSTAAKQTADAIAKLAAALNTGSNIKQPQTAAA